MSYEPKVYRSEGGDTLTVASGGTLTIESGATFEVHGSDFSSTEFGAIDGVTAGTVTASKAVIVDANKDAGDFRNLDCVNLDCGTSAASGAGTVDIFADGASKGKFNLSCANQDADYTIALAPLAMGQTTTLAIPDPGASSAYVLLTSQANDQVRVTATAAEINDVTDVSAQDKMAPSTVVDATVESYVSSVRTVGNMIKTEILIDLTGAKSTTTDLDIIGDTGACHFGQITTAINGAIVCGQMTCLEVPATGADDIDLYMASVGTGAYDADASGLTNAAALITKGGAWTVTPPSAGTAFASPVTANYYLYLACGEAGTVGTYTAGKFLIELWGIA